MAKLPKAQDYPFLGISAYRWYQLLVRAEEFLPEPFMYFGSRRLADIIRMTDHRGHEAVLHNLRIILGPDVPEKQIRKLARGVFYEAAAYIVEFLGQRRWARKWLSGRGWDIEGIEHVEQNTAAGRGVMVVSAHFSNWEIGAAILATRGQEVYVTALEHEDPRIDVLFNNLRNMWGYKTMPINESIRLTLDALRNGKVVTLLGDRALGLNTVEVEFFGRKMLMPAAPARMALHTSAALVPAFISREGRNTFHVKFFPEIRPLEGVEEKQNVKYLVQQYAHTLEEMVRTFPSQWIRFTPIGEETPG